MSEPFVQQPSPRFHLDADLGQVTTFFALLSRTTIDLAGAFPHLSGPVAAAVPAGSEPAAAQNMPGTP